MQYVISRVMSDFLFQYQTGGFPPITLSTGTPADLRRGMAYLEEFSKEDVPERIFVEVTIPITSQFDKTQEILNAVQALGARYLSKETLWEATDMVDDFEVERERIKQDLVENDPFIISMDIIQGMWNRYETLRLQGRFAAAEALKKYIMLKEMEVGMRQGIPERGGQGGGIPPQLAPPESRSSPDVANSIFRQGPSGINRRPQTPVEREQNKGRKGVLYNAQGEVLI